MTNIGSEHPELAARISEIIRETDSNDAAESILELLAASGRLIEPGEVQRVVSMVVRQLQEARSDVDLLLEQRSNVLLIAIQAYHEASRWEDPLPVPAWVEAIRAAVDAENPMCACGPCSGASARRARNKTS